MRQELLTWAYPFYLILTVLCNTCFESHMATSHVRYLVDQTLNAHVILLTERPLGMDPFYTPLALYYVTVLPQRSLFENICSDYKTRAFQKEWTMRRMLDYNDS